MKNVLKYENALIQKLHDLNQQNLSCKYVLVVKVHAVRLESLAPLLTNV